MTQYDQVQVLWPLPRNLSQGNKTSFYFKIKDHVLDLPLEINIKNEKQKDNKDLVRASANRFYSLLQDPNFSQNVSLSQAFMALNNKTEYKVIEKFKIDIKGSGEYPRQPTVDDEKYVLKVDKDGILIEADSVIGAINGISTLN